jgi:hypothetical protein
MQIAERYPIAVVPEHLVGYRSHASAMSRQVQQMVRSWELAFDILARSSSPISPEVVEWALGASYLDLAQSAAANGEYQSALAALARAVRMDPLRSGTYLSYRFLRTLRRLIRGRPPSQARIDFGAMSPTTAMKNDPHELRLFATILRKIDERRMDRLASQEIALDASLHQDCARAVRTSG